MVVGKIGIVVESKIGDAKGAEERRMARRARDFYVHFLIARDGGQYSALCYEYNVATCAKTVEGAVKDLMAATVAYLESFIERGEEPESRPASRGLLLEFLGLDPGKAQFSRNELEKVLKSCYSGNARLRAPLIYRLDRRRFETPLHEALRSPRTGSYPVAICHA